MGEEVEGPRTKERLYRVEMYGVRRMCVCGGEMLRTESPARLSLPPQWEHKCDGGCGHTEWFSAIYPAIRHEVTKERI